VQRVLNAAMKPVGPFGLSELAAASDAGPAGAIRAL
jgi:hypothetical protein